MKFSVLLPSRNGGKLIRNCIASVLDQSYSDLELIVSDNANTDETADVVREFRGDSRLKYVRSEKFLSVTENWNNAFRASSGDYILMIGDDDYLLPGFFDRMSRAIDEHGKPDCIAYNAYCYVFPNALEGDASSYYSDPHFTFDQDFLQERMLPLPVRRKVVYDMFRFNPRFPLNMQLVLVSREASKLVRGGLYQPPFPDHLAINSLLIAAKKFLFLPEKRLIVGVSPKSFGFYFFNNRQEQGFSYLASNPNFAGQLSGNEFLNSVHIWLNILKKNYPDLLGGYHVHRMEYLRRQIHSWLVQFARKQSSFPQLLHQMGQVPLHEWAAVSLSFLDKRSLQKFVKAIVKPKNDRIRSAWQGLQSVQGVANIREFSQWICRNSPDAKVSGG